MSKVVDMILNPRTAVSYARHRILYLKLRLSGEDPESLNFYKELQDTKIQEGEAYPRGFGIGQAQIKFLKRIGLDQDDVLLDIGCGNLRGGRYMIEYLSPRNYTGIDISEKAIHRGRENIEQWGYSNKEPTLFVNKNMKFLEFDPNSFDYVFANSVLTHISEKYIRECFANLGRILKNDAVAALSYNHSEQADKSLTKTVKNSNIYRYSYEELAGLATEYDFEVSHDSYKEHPTDEMQMIILD